MLAEVLSDYDGESLNGRRVGPIAMKHKLLQDFSRFHQILK